MSEDPIRRLREHNSRKVRSTRPYAPFKLVYVEEVETLGMARKREKYLKTAAGRKFIRRILDKPGT
jgi:putative endonuclease